MIRWLSKKRNQKGFTLIELIVVIAIFGILAAIAIPKLGMSRVTAEVSAHNSNVRMIEGAAAMYIAQEGKNPAEIGDLDPNYINKVPSMPKAVEDKAIQKTYIIEMKDGEIVVKPGFATIVNKEVTVAVDSEKIE